MNRGSLVGRDSDNVRMFEIINLEFIILNH